MASRLEDTRADIRRSLAEQDRKVEGIEKRNKSFRRSTLNYSQEQVLPLANLNCPCLRYLIVCGYSSLHRRPRCATPPHRQQGLSTKRLIRFFAIPQQREQEEAQAPVPNSPRNGSYSFALVLQRNPAPVGAPPAPQAAAAQRPRLQVLLPKVLVCSPWGVEYVYGKGLSSSLCTRRSS